MSDSVIIIDYGMGNLQSVFNAFRLLGYNVVISSRPDQIARASHIVLPGVGAFAEGIRSLKGLGLIDALEQEVIEKGKPFLGICLGMQLICKESFENGTHAGLGWVPASVKRLNTMGQVDLRIPHVGWNTVSIKNNNCLFRNMSNQPVFYFVHSYHCVFDENDEKLVTSRCFYGDNFVSSIQKNNIFATQFHPEKSQIEGLELLKNFVEFKS